MAGLYSKWKDEYYATVYELVRAGAKMETVAQALGVGVGTLKKWHANNPALKETVKRAKSLATSGGKDAGRSFLDYCYQRLPDRLKVLWDQLAAAENQPNPERAIELLLADEGKRTKQLLAVHTLVTSARWNVSDAMRRIGEPRSTWTTWVAEDPDFQALVLSVREMQRDYLEGAYFGLVAAGDTAAILFGMKTLNAERGYGTKVTVDHKHDGSVLHAHVDLDKLDVDIDTKRKMLDAIRKDRENLPAAEGGPKALNPALPPELLLDEDEG